VRRCGGKLGGHHEAREKERVEEGWRMKEEEGEGAGGGDGEGGNHEAVHVGDGGLRGGRVVVAHKPVPLPRPHHTTPPRTAGRSATPSPASLGRFGSVQAGLCKFGPGPRTLDAPESLSLKTVALTMLPNDAKLPATRIIYTHAHARTHTHTSPARPPSAPPPPHTRTCAQDPQTGRRDAVKRQ
jgi:hypothetical protein